MQSDFGQRRGYQAVSNSNPSSPHLASFPNTPRTPPSRSSAHSSLSPFRTPQGSSTSLPLTAGMGDGGSMRSSKGTLSDQYHLSPDPADWGADVFRPEADDALHDPNIGEKPDARRSIWTGRGIRNIGCIALLGMVVIGVFLGYPLASHFANKPHDQNAIANNTSAAPQALPNISNWAVIDEATPKEMHKIYSYADPTKELQLVFSDEFEVEGRSFYPGDDPYWEAVDLHYWSTGDLEWYDPAAVTTRNGALELKLTKVDDITLNHNLSYRSGMVSSWNKFCFSGGLILASVNLPGNTDVLGLWPAIWTMGNLGRAGYGATLEGMWPYSYDNCDVGTLPNQTLPDLSGPAAALDTGSNNGILSYLPGQRLSRCTCKGESHPGPVHSEDGSYVGRSAPEIDMFEAQIEDTNIGRVSQSAQWAPFDASYLWFNTTENMVLAQPTMQHQNGYAGGIYQEAASVVTTTNQTCYQGISSCYATHGFEYVPGYDNAYITWLTNNQISWTLNAAGVGPNNATQIGAREITQEPMYILMNLGLSYGFVPSLSLTEIDGILPTTMRIDWVRVYQDPKNINIGCDPSDRPTQDYINTYIEAYTNPNLTTWTDDFGQPKPKNSLEPAGC
ncbi:GH16 domain-containing protein [Mycena chlorophos]|uniref:GH16 domain-containing protein n=1 Tax=Mycena chlorophos TaxID=658473 RepID=A0A8H6TP50_MYCCL|nr:GH16 domain-containing protein [Mycena chlorophos]